MRLYIILLLAIFFSTGIINAQTDFRLGYIIKSTGDTINGEIDYRGDLLMSSVCKFKDIDNTIIEYSSNDITAFRFTDSKYYVSREVNNRRVFLEYLIKGKINIYYMRDDVGDHYYIDKEDVVLKEIPFEEGIKLVDDRQVFYETTKHIGILNYYMQDAPGFQSNIETIKKPEHKNLIKLAEDYHNAVCDDEQCIIYEKKVPPIKISIMPFVGLAKYKEYDQFIMELGGYLYLWAPRTSEKLFFKTGLIYQKSSEGGENLNSYKIPIQLQYIYIAHRIQPNLSMGINVLSLNIDDHKELSHTLSINAGINYKFSDNISLSTVFNSDYTPPSSVIIDKELAFDIISYSIIIGLRIDL